MSQLGITALLAEIISKVFQNTRKSVTGQDVQDVMIDMTDSLNQATYSASITYNVGQSVIFENTVYLCLINTASGESPYVAPTKWKFIASKTFDDSVKSISGIDDATSLWLIDIKTIHYKGYTYFCYNDYSDNTRRIIKYDHSTESWGTPEIIPATSFVGSGNVTGRDYAHAAPSVFIDSDGYIHLSYGGYKQTTMYVMKSTNVEDITAWDSEVQITTGENSCSYPTMIEVNSVLVLFYRGNDGSGPLLKRVISSDLGATWGNEVVITDYYPYYQVRYNPDTDRTHIAWHSFTTVMEDLFYVYSDDIEVASPDFYDVADSLQSLPLTVSDAVVFDSSVAWDTFYLMGLDFDTDDVVHIIGLATDSVNTDKLMHFSYSASWDNVTVLADNGIESTLSSTGTCEGDVKCNRDDSSVSCIFSINVTEVEIQEYKSPNNGVMWIKNKNITENSTVDNANPSYVRNNNNIEVIWFNGNIDYGVGKYIFYK